jgi:hypothetical protein
MKQETDTELAQNAVCHSHTGLVPAKIGPRAEY